MSMSKRSSPPATYNTHELKNCSTIELAKNEITQSSDKLREKNAVRDGKLNTSDLGTFLHVVKSSLGSGFLAMPYAFSNIGLIMGPICTALVALICAHCTHIVVKSSQELCFLQGKSGMGYTETVEAAFMYGAGRRLSKYKGFVRIVSDVFMFVTYYGVNIVYVIVIASSLKQVVENHLEFSMSIRLYSLVLIVVLLPVGIVRHLKFLVPFSALANVLLLVGCVLTIYICCLDLPPISSRALVTDVSRWPLFFSTAIFGMEGIGTIMPIENAMRNPGHFLGCPGVLNLGMTVIALVFLVVGSIGFLKYGDEAQGSVTLNLPQDALSETVKMLIALAILFTYPLQLTASLEVVWEAIKDKFSEKRQDFAYYLVRSLLIVGTVIIAAALPNLSPVITLIGAVGFSGLGLLIPTVVELVTFWDSLVKPCGLTIIKAGVLVVIWAFATVSGSITSIQEIIEDYQT